jgi:type VI secretion system FHA domain protein
MTIVLRIENTQTDIPLVLPKDGLVEADLDLSIGRAADNDLVLEDPAGTISKRHCTITRMDSQHVLIDHSRNGTFFNRDSHALTRDAPVPLNPGDFIQIGCFGLTVVTTAVPGMRSTAYESDAEKSPDERSFLGAVSPMPSPHAHLAHIDPGGLISRREEPFDIEEDVRDSAAPDFLGDPHANGLRSDNDDLLLGRRFQATKPPRAYADHVAVPNGVFVQPRVGTEPIPDDWDLLAEMGRPAPPPAARPVPPILFDQSAAMPPPGPLSQLPDTTTSGALERRASRDSAAIAAFIQGCGLSAEECDTADIVMVMGRAGRALRLSVTNLHDILGARTSTKEGFGVERTMLGQSGNNPLKFVLDSHDALVALLVTTIPGFLVADEAVEQAFTDIKEHQISMVAAMQAALAGICQQLAPETIELMVGAPTMLERLMPHLRSARWWRSYRAAFAKVAGGLANNARQVFGGDFARGYRHDEPSEQGSSDVG